MRLTELALYILHHISLKQGATLDMQDDDGMTALHYASVLGQLELVKQLLAKGARKTQNIYMEFPEDLTEYEESDVRKILESVKVDPDRDEKALLNQFHDKNRQIIMVMEKIIDGTVVIMLTRKTTDSTVVRPCFISSKKKNEEFLKDILDNNDLIDSTKLILNKTRVAMSGIDKEFIRNQCKVLTGTNLISACMNGQVEVRKYWISEQDNSHDGRNKNEEKYKISSSHYSFHNKKIEDQKNINYNSSFTSR